jgi:GR25 family glycosyltransferase involved in LPS biosynthesis
MSQSQQPFSVYLISSVHEHSRKQHLELLLKAFPGTRQVEAIYPSYTRVPFLKQLKDQSKLRGGRSLRDGEIGLILTSRNIWRDILKKATNDEEHFLILESDSKLIDVAMLKAHFNEATHDYDIFFWGAWLGHLRLMRSKRRHLQARYYVGAPLINSVSGTYGYSINRKAASCLLKATRRIAHPVDEFKKYLHPGQLRLGAVVPELISVHDVPSTIRPNAFALMEKIWIFVLDIRNYFLSLLN